MNARLLPLAALLLVACGGAARAATIGIGAYAGGSIPVVQDDRETGPIAGLRVPVALTHWFTAEPCVSIASYGNRTYTLAGETLQRDGGRVSAIGGDVLLAAPGIPGFHLYPYAGVALHRSARFGTGIEDRVGYNFGLGVGWTFPSHVSLELRSEMAMIVNQQDASRKFGNITLGLGYHFAAPEP